MRLSKTFWQTYKEVPADAEIVSHQLMIRSGLIHKSGAGIYNLLPFGLKVIKKIENIVREELDKIDCQEVQMTVVTPGELWKKSGRWQEFGDEMLKFKDKGDRDLCISPTNEEAVTDIFSKVVKSYKNLPVTLYQINNKFRDEIRPRFGLLRGREFIMKDAYSFCVDMESLDKSYEDLYRAYSKIIERIGLEYIVVEADAGSMADPDKKTHEFQVIADSGEDTVIYSDSYAANIEKAKTYRTNVDFNFDEQKLTEVETIGKTSIEEVSNFLNISSTHTLKNLVYFYEDGKESKPVLVILLGDDQLNELKLKNYLGAQKVYPATDNDLQELGLVKGYIGPFNLPKDLRILIDEEINQDAFYTVGAQKENYHVNGFKFNRDINNFEVSDLRLAKEGDLAPNKKDIVSLKKGIEVGHIFQLGDKYTKSMEVTVLDKNGKALHPLMGCYGIGITRMAGAAIEQSHDEKGIVWPKEISPFDLHFVSIAKSDEVKNLCDEIYTDLKAKSIDVIYDDRNAGPGFKFKDADLLGVPYQLILGERDYKKSGNLSLVNRKTGQKIEFKKEELYKILEEKNIL